MMKQKVFSILLAVVLVFGLSIPGFAEAQLPPVTDSAGILDPETIASLTLQAMQITEDHQFGIYIITVNDFTDYYETDSIDAATQQLYFDYRLGEGEDESGLLLLLSMAQRKYCIYAYGYGNVAFTDYGKEVLSEEFLDDFANDDWAAGFEDYLSFSDRMLTQAQAGEPLDVPVSPNPGQGYADSDQPSFDRFYGVLACILLGFGVAFLVTGILKGQLRSVAAGDEADAFVAGKGLQLSLKTDTFTHTTQSRVYDPPQKDNSSGGSSGGGTTVNSSGGSSRSGSF